MWTVYRRHFFKKLFYRQISPPKYLHMDTYLIWTHILGKLLPYQCFLLIGRHDSIPTCCLVAFMNTDCSCRIFSINLTEGFNCLLKCVRRHVLAVAVKYCPFWYNDNYIFTKCIRKCLQDEQAANFYSTSITTDKFLMINHYFDTFAISNKFSSKYCIVHFP